MKLHREASGYVDAIIFVSQEGADNFHQLRLGSVVRMIPLKNQLALLKQCNCEEKN